MNEKAKFVQMSCDFYDQHSESDKQWFVRNYDQCDEPHQKDNICMYQWQFPLYVLRSQQAEIDQLKEKNKALVNALVNTNAEKAMWAHDCWDKAERLAEYCSMLMSSDSELAVSCFKKEKRIEHLDKQHSELHEEHTELLAFNETLDRKYKAAEKQAEKYKFKVDMIADLLRDSSDQELTLKAIKTVIERVME